MDNASCRIVLLPGDGIGPEVVEAARLVMDAAAAESGFSIVFEKHPFGGAATDTVGEPLPPATLEACTTCDGILLGAVGGPRWDGMDRVKRPEFGLLALRKALGAFANLRPVSVSPALAEVSPLRSEVVSGTDLLVVRELTGGIYYSEPRGRSGDEAFNTMRYSRDEIERIARVAFSRAAKRRNAVVSVDKSNVLEVSVLWREVVKEIHGRDHSGVALRHMYVDNAAMQIATDPRQFDVILTGNMFGDILSDLAGTLAGSLGMLPSACVGGEVGLFEPVHGSAPDIAGRGVANPVGAILSGAMLFDEIGRPGAAERIRKATDRALLEGFRTPDIRPAGGRAFATMEMAEAVAERLTTTVESDS